MNINKFNFLLTSIATCLIIYLLWSLCGKNEDDSLKVLLCFSGLISMLSALTGATSCVFEDVHHSVNAKILSWIFFALFFIEHLLFALIGISQNAIIITTGLFLVIYVATIHAITKIKM